MSPFHLKMTLLALVPFITCVDVQLDILVTGPWGPFLRLRTWAAGTRRSHKDRLFLKLSRSPHFLSVSSQLFVTCLLTPQALCPCWVRGGKPCDLSLCDMKANWTRVTGLTSFGREHRAQLRSRGTLRHRGESR